MNKFNKITVCVEGKNIKVEVGTYTLRTLIIKKLNGMAAFKESKHQYKIWTFSKRKNVRERLALEGKSKKRLIKSATVSTASSGSSLLKGPK